MARFALVALLALPLPLLGACRKSEKEAPVQGSAAASTPVAEPAKAPSAPAAAAPGPANPITEEDFESEAARDVSADNLDSSLDKLEREIREK